MKGSSWGKSKFLKRGAFGDKISAVPVAQIHAPLPFGRESAFFQSWTVQNLALREYSVEVRGHPPTKSKPYCCPLIRTVWFCARLHVVIGRELSSGGFRSMLSTPETGYIFGPCVSPQVVLQGAPGPPAFKLFLSRSLVGSTCWVGIWVREVIKCNCFMRRGFGIRRFFQVAQSHILGGIWICHAGKPWDFETFCSDCSTKQSCGQVRFHREVKRIALEIWLCRMDQNTLQWVAGCLVKCYNEVVLWGLRTRVGSAPLPKTMGRGTRHNPTN